MGLSCTYINPFETVVTRTTKNGQMNKWKLSQTNNTI